ncbi:MAG: hypothetical protein NXI31_06265 [bacterium]|nr:hypothetical protein [bacterium]
MKLQPVYLLAPEPEPKSMTSRRAFLLAGCTFATGTLIGGACGYSLGASRGSGEPEDPKKVGSNDEVELKSTGDSTLDELRRLAIKAPVGDLCAKADLFMNLKGLDYPDDPVLWQGMGRLMEEAVNNPNQPFERNTLSLLIRFVEKANPPQELRLDRYLPALRERRNNTKRKD